MKDEIDIPRALAEAFEEDCRDAKIPSADAVYWRASIRARADAARRVDQPLTIAQAFAAAAVAGVGVAVVSFALKALPQLSELSGVTIAALCAAAVVIVSPLVLVVALGRDS
jgi:hypothetical protein